MHRNAQTKPPLMLIGSELQELAKLKAEAITELEDGIALYRQRHPGQLDYFGLHTKIERLSGRVLHKIYWHDVNEADSHRSGLIASVTQEEQFIEIVATVLAKMASVRYRQKSFKFTHPETKTA